VRKKVLIYYVIVNNYDLFSINFGGLREAAFFFFFARPPREEGGGVKGGQTKTKRLWKKKNIQTVKKNSIIYIISFLISWFNCFHQIFVNCNLKKCVKNSDIFKSKHILWSEFFTPVQPNCH
jgi:hypothetical protein